PARGPACLRGQGHAVEGRGVAGLPGQEKIEGRSERVLVDVEIDRAVGEAVQRVLADRARRSDLHEHVGGRGRGQAADRRQVVADERGDRRVRAIARIQRRRVAVFTVAVARIAVAVAVPRITVARIPVAVAGKVSEIAGFAVSLRVIALALAELETRRSTAGWLLASEQRGQQTGSSQANRAASHGGEDSPNCGAATYGARPRAWSRASVLAVVRRADRLMHAWLPSGSVEDSSSALSEGTVFETGDETAPAEPAPL